MSRLRRGWGKVGLAWQALGCPGGGRGPTSTREGEDGRDEAEEGKPG